MAELRVLLTEPIWEACPECGGIGSDTNANFACHNCRAGNPCDCNRSGTSLSGWHAATCSSRKPTGSVLVASLVVDAQAVQQRCDYVWFHTREPGRAECPVCSGSGWLPVPPGSYKDVELWQVAVASADDEPREMSAVPLGVVAHVDVIERERIRSWPVKSQQHEGPGCVAEWVTEMDPRMHIGQMDAAGMFDMHEDLFDGLPDVPVLALLSDLSEIS